VEIDYCPQCRRVWLDRGEFDKIIERPAQTSGPVRDTHEVHRNDEYRQPYYGKKEGSFLGKMFDFD
jgi:uncharacterized protein